MKQTVRFTMDMDLGQHTYLKMMAAKEGASMKEYITNHLPSPSISEDLGDAEFKKILNQIVDEHSETFKRLSKR